MASHEVFHWPCLQGVARLPTQPLRSGLCEVGQNIVEGQPDLPRLLTGVKVSVDYTVT